MTLIRLVAARTTLAMLCAVWLASCSNSAHVPVTESQTSRSAVNRDVTTGDRYIVQPGDTLFGIAFRFDLDYRKLGAANGLKHPYRIFPGNVLVLKEASVAPAKKTVMKNTTVKPPPVKPEPKQTVIKTAKTPSQTLGKQVERDSVKAPVSAGGSLWQWPVSGKVERYFSSDGLSKGLDISGAIGTPIHSARAGQVIYAGSRLKGYGKLIIIRHDDVYLSAYAHNRVILVEEGQAVKQGDIIAELGMTGTQSPRLHFEIRRAGKPINPLELLPKQ